VITIFGYEASATELAEFFLEIEARELRSAEFRNIEFEVAVCATNRWDRN
jgi:hypothetical protein